VALLLSSAGASLGSAVTATETLPAPEALPGHTVAVVSHIPVRLRTITIKELNRAILQAAAQAGLKAAPATGQAKYPRLEEEALGELLDGLWIQGQAEEMEIVVTDKQIANELAQIKKENFKSGKEFHAFLKHSHFTLRDVRYRVELQILSTRIQERVAIGTWTQKEAQAVFSAFVDAYEERWRSRTVCAPQYAIKRCSNG
jgi:FKBP-type peptidyl-prolyl cis-trans isomerase (trigger factor)